jgi:hypothetical protein
MTEQVKRYAVIGFGHKALLGHESGRYVEHADYERLEQECAELRDENTARLEHIGEIGAAGFFAKIGTLDQLIAERDAALKQVDGLRDLLTRCRKVIAHEVESDWPSLDELIARIDAALSDKP